MKLVITYEIDFQDREDTNTIREHELKLIPTAYKMAMKLPSTAITTIRTIKMVEEVILPINSYSE